MTLSLTPPPPAYPSLAQENPLDVLRLIRSENVGPVTFFNLVSYFGSVKAALERAPDMSRRGGKKREIKIPAPQQVEQELELAHNFGAQILLYGSEDYPAWLTAIYDPPPLLMALGSTEHWKNKPCIAIVGSRNASANGFAFSRRLARECGEAGMSVISGLARGIDTAAHQGALAYGTVAAIAGGIDNIYPPENEPLYKQLQEKGAILSEQPFGATPHARSFPGRNRIISGISCGTVVTEAAPRSGSLITASYALEQGREVFAVPGSPLDPRSKGTNQLLRNGATLLESAEDILNTLQQWQASPSPSCQPRLLEEPMPSALQEESPAQSEERRNEIIDKLGKSIVSIDELLLQCQLSPGELAPVLLELELAGKLVRQPGNRVCLLAEATDETAEKDPAHLQPEAI